MVIAFISGLTNKTREILSYLVAGMFERYMAHLKYIVLQSSLKFKPTISPVSRENKCGLFWRGKYLLKYCVVHGFILVVLLERVCKKLP